MPSNNPSEIKKFRHGIMNSISGQVTVYGLDGAQWTYSRKSSSSLSRDGILIIDDIPVTENDSRFIQKTEPITTNVTTHNNVASRFFSPPARPSVQPVESSRRVDEQSQYGFCMMRIGNYNNMGSCVFYVNPEKNTVTMIHAGVTISYKGRNVSLINNQVVIDNIPVSVNDSRIIHPLGEEVPTQQMTENLPSATNNAENNNTEKKSSLKAQVVAGTLLGLWVGLEALLVCVLPRKNVAATENKNINDLFERFPVFYITVVAPIIEEQIFRKYLPRWMNKGFKKIGFSPDAAELSSMVLSNLLFTVGHKDEWFEHFTSGMCLSLVNKYYGGGQVSNSVAHIVGNYLGYLTHRRILNTASPNGEPPTEMSLPKPS